MFKLKWKKYSIPETNRTKNNLPLHQHEVSTLLDQFEHSEEKNLAIYLKKENVWFFENHSIFIIQFCINFLYWLIIEIFISLACLPKGTKTAMKNRIWNIMRLVFWMQHWAHARLLLFDLANDDEYQEDKNKEGCNWEGRRKKCIPLFVVQNILKFILYITV